MALPWIIGGAIAIGAVAIAALSGDDEEEKERQERAEQEARRREQEAKRMREEYLENVKVMITRERQKLDAKKKELAKQCECIEELQRLEKFLDSKGA